MVAAAKGLIDLSKRLLAMGANPDTRASNGWQAMDFARHFRAPTAAELLAEADPDAELCAQYQLGFDDSEVDVDLVASLVECVKSLLIKVLFFLCCSYYFILCYQ